MKPRVLILDDDTLLLAFIDDALKQAGFECEEAESLSAAFLAIQAFSPSIVLADYTLKEGTAFDLLDWLKAEDLSIPVIVFTGMATIELAVEAVKRGAVSFMAKPLDVKHMITLIHGSLENFRAIQRNVAVKRERARYERDPFLGNSPAIGHLKKAAERLLDANSTILIQGETGTGKAVLAKWLHQMGPRSSEPFVDLNCAGLSNDLLESELFGHQKGAFTGAHVNKLGLLEAAHHGTLFLDEIGEMVPLVQAKVLKVVEEKQFYRLGDVKERRVDVQIIAATHHNLREHVNEGRFREDLFYRINALTLAIPPLRERREDIPLLAAKLLDQLGWDMKRGPFTLSARARRELENYSWPGNIRELRNVLERAVLLSENGLIDETGLEHLPHEHRQRPGTISGKPLTLEEMEKAFIEEALELEGGRVAPTAKRLGIPRSSLYAKLRTYGIQAS
jgi:DNA-binding NtrC family response regulator